jgi:hypothetical protein
MRELAISKVRLTRYLKLHPRCVPSKATATGHMDGEPMVSTLFDFAPLRWVHFTADHLRAQVPSPAARECCGQCVTISTAHPEGCLDPKRCSPLPRQLTRDPEKTVYISS